MRPRLLLFVAVLVLVAGGMAWLLSTEATDPTTHGPEDRSQAPAPELLPGTQRPEPPDADQENADKAADTPATDAAKLTRTVRLNVRPSTARLKHKATVDAASYMAQKTETKWATAGMFERTGGEGGHGSFVARNVPAGEYMVVVNTTYGAHKAMAHERFSVPEAGADEVDIEVVWNAGDPDVETHRLLVRVVNEPGEPVAGARVWPSYDKGNHWGNLTGTWITDARGEVTIDAPASDYLLTIRSSAYATSQARFEMQGDHELTVTMRTGAVTWTVKPTLKGDDLGHFQVGVYIKQDDPRWRWRSVEKKATSEAWTLTFPRLVASEQYVMLLTGQKVAAQVWAPDGTTRDATWRVDVHRGRDVPIVAPRAIPEAELKKAGVQIAYDGMIGKILTETRRLGRAGEHWVIPALSDVAANVWIRWKKRSFRARLPAAADAEPGAKLTFEER